MARNIVCKLSESDAKMCLSTKKIIKLSLQNTYSVTSAIQMLKCFFGWWALNWSPPKTNSKSCKTFLLVKSSNVLTKFASKSICFPISRWILSSRCYRDLFPVLLIILATRCACSSCPSTYAKLTGFSRANVCLILVV